MDMELSWILSHPIATLLVAYIFYVLCLVIYRLHFHPLAKFPGPKYAAISRWHEFYYEVVKKGQFTFKVQEYHKKYGQSPFSTLWPFVSTRRTETSVKVRLSALYQMNSTSKIRSSMTICTPKPGELTSMSGWQADLGATHLCSPLALMSYIVCVVVP